MMWIKLDHRSKYNLNFVRSAVDKVSITDFITVWSTTYTDASLLECLQTSNPNLDIDTNDVDLAKHMLTLPEYLKREKTIVVEGDGTLTVALLGDKSKIGYPLHIKMTLTEGSKQMFYELVTCDLLGAIQKLRESETELIRLLTKKDDEISEYKCEGGEIALRHLKTVPFDQEAHWRRYMCPMEHIPDPDCLHHISKRDPEPANNTIKSELSPDVRTMKTESSSDVRTMKTESSSDTMKTESSSDVRTMKTESSSDTMKTESSSDIMKTESDSCSTCPGSDVRLVKTEPSQSNRSPRKKRIKLNI